MEKDRGYQLRFSVGNEVAHDKTGRERKAQTIIAVLRDFMQTDLSTINVLDLGSSTGLMDYYLADYFGQLTGIDIDMDGVTSAQQNLSKPNLKFQLGDAMAIEFGDDTFDLVICTQVYEHVPDAARMIREIERVLKPSGICYFAAGNRLSIMEHHYRLPFLSIVPKPLGHLYLKLTRKGSFYYETHYSYWGLKKLVRNFELIDYTKKVLSEPEKFGIDYMLKPGSRKAALARLFAKLVYWAVPTYIWLLRKKGAANA